MSPSPSTLRPIISAARPRTLPLVVSGVLAGGAATLTYGSLQWWLLLPTLLVGILLQVLSNLANDYGDALSGVDAADRVGEQRQVSSGGLTRRQMKIAIGVVAALAFAAGCLLLYVDIPIIGMAAAVALFALGCLAIVAAILYTCGPHPYGYHALGDLAVLLFFGLFVVNATQFLQLGRLTAATWLLSGVVGLLAVAVLNCNNLRDIASDTRAGKMSVARQLGDRNARRYQAALIALSLLLALAYILCIGNFYALFALAAYLPLAMHLRRVLRGARGEDLDREMPRLGRATLLFATLLLAAQYVAVC